MGILDACEAEIEDVVEGLRHARKHGDKCTLLIGAGCSFSGNMPLASGFVDHIREHHQAAHRRACHASSPREPSYPECMDALDPAARRTLISDFVTNAKINWAHIAIAQLMKEGYVDRVLTTNFDNLLVRACALISLFPAVYDLTMQHESILVDDLPDHSIFYLHGQSTGFCLMNTLAEMQENAPKLRELFNFGRGGQTWIVAGYSGENDPVFQAYLAGVNRFWNSLYWVGYKDSPPAKEVCDSLFSRQKYAKRVKGYDADEFFCRLSGDLRCFPPLLVQKPFSYLDGLLSNISPYPLRGELAGMNPFEATQRAIHDLVRQHELSPPGPSSARRPGNARLAEATARYMARDYEHVIALWLAADPGDREALAETASWAYIEQGNDLFRRAQKNSGYGALYFFKLAEEKYKQALALRPDSPVALDNWGAALADSAELTPLPGAEALYRQAYDNYDKAATLRPEYAHVWGNWGMCLARHARRTAGDAAEAMLHEAAEKFGRAIALDPKNPKTYRDCGNSLLWLAQKTSTSPASEPLAGDVVDQAEAMYRRADALAPGFGAYNLACVASVRGDGAACRQWLEKSLEQGRLPAKTLLQGDPDLSGARSEPWFEAFLAKAFEKDG